MILEHKTKLKELPKKLGTKRHAKMAIIGKFMFRSSNVELPLFIIDVECRGNRLHTLYNLIRKSPGVSSIGSYTMVDATEES